MKEPKWISVDDRLPENWENYLVTDGEDVLVANWSYGYWSMVPSDDRGDHNWDVTHWMPLPKPPKE